MIQTYSTVTKQYYNTPEEALAAEKKIADAEAARKKAKEELTTKINEVERQRSIEVKDCMDKFNALTARIEKLIKERDQIKVDIQHINDEAEAQIYSLRRTAENKAASNAECSINIKTFDSTKDKTWKTVVDEHGKLSDVEKKLQTMRSNPDLKKMLTYFGI